MIVLDSSPEATAESMLCLDCYIAIITDTITQARSIIDSHCLFVEYSQMLEIY